MLPKLSKKRFGDHSAVTINRVIADVYIFDEGFGIIVEWSIRAQPNIHRSKGAAVVCAQTERFALIFGLIRFDICTIAFAPSDIPQLKWFIFWEQQKNDLNLQR